MARTLVAVTFEQLPAATAPTRGALPSFVRGIALTQASAVSSQLGASFGALAFPALGPVGVVAVRQLVAAAVLVPVGRPRVRALRRSDWITVVALALTFTLMNTSVYLSVERLGLGMAITLEFLGPLTLVIVSARRLIDFVAGIAAAIGVVVLVDPSPTTDLVGLGTGLLSAIGWAGYILLTRRVGRTLPGMQGPALASAISALLWLPLAVVLCVLLQPPLWAVLCAVACGVLASVVPFSFETIALRRLPAGLFSMLQSMHPVWAAAAGFVVLHQALNFRELAGIGLVVMANIIVTAVGRRPLQA